MRLGRLACLRHRPCGHPGRVSPPSPLRTSRLMPCALAGWRVSANGRADVEAGPIGLAGWRASAIAHADVEDGPIASAGPRASANGHADAEAHADRRPRCARRRLSPARASPPTPARGVEAGPCAFAGPRASANAHADVEAGPCAGSRLRHRPCGRRGRSPPPAGRFAIGRADVQAGPRAFARLASPLRQRPCGRRGRPVRLSGRSARRDRSKRGSAMALRQPRRTAERAARRLEASWPGDRRGWRAPSPSSRRTRRLMPCNSAGPPAFANAHADVEAGPSASVIVNADVEDGPCAIVHTDVKVGRTPSPARPPSSRADVEAGPIACHDEKVSNTLLY